MPEEPSQTRIEAMRACIAERPEKPDISDDLYKGLDPIRVKPFRRALDRSIDRSNVVDIVIGEVDLSYVLNGLLGSEELFPENDELKTRYWMANMQCEELTWEYLRVMHPASAEQMAKYIQHGHQNKGIMIKQKQSEDIEALLLSPNVSYYDMREYDFHFERDSVRQMVRTIRNAAIRSLVDQGRIVRGLYPGDRQRRLISLHPHYIKEA